MSIIPFLLVKVNLTCMIRMSLGKQFANQQNIKGHMVKMNLPRANSYVVRMGNICRIV